MKWYKWLKAMTCHKNDNYESVNNNEDNDNDDDNNHDH